MKKHYLYNYEAQYNSYKKKLEEKNISKKNRELIKQYDRDSTLKDKMALPTIIKYYDILITVASEYTNKDFDKLTKEDFEKIIEQINNRDDILIATKQKYWCILKKFASWLAYGDKIFNGMKRNYPETISWLNTSIKSKDLPKIKAGDIITEEEIDKLIESTDNVRDKAFLSMLYETGSRISELGNIKIKDVSEHPHGYLIDLASGKTGERNVIVVFSSSKLAAWLNLHPTKNDKDSYVWVVLQDDKFNKHRRGEPLTYRALYKIVTRTKEKAGIKKRIHPHAFRHARVTHLLANKQLNETQAKVYFGWSPSSKMIAQYSHLSSADVNRTMLSINGIEPEEKDVNGKQARVCRNCGKPNDPKDSFCGFCSRPLDFKVLMEQQEKIERADKIFKKTGVLDVNRTALKEAIKEMIKSGEISIN